MPTHVAPSAATIAPRSIPRRYVYTSVHDGLRCLQMWIQCLGFTRQLSATYCAHLVLISNLLFPQCAFQLPASIWFHDICRFPPVGLSTSSAPRYPAPPVPLSNFLHAFGFNISASPVSQQVLALIWFQYLTFPPVLLIKLLQLPAFIGLQYLYSTLQGVQRPSPCDTLGFPPPSHSALFFSISTLHTSVPHLRAFTWLQYLNFPPPCASHQFPAFIRLVSRLHLWPLNNFLHASQLGFNV